MIHGEYEFQNRIQTGRIIVKRGISSFSYKGFSLIELSMAMAIFSMGLGGLSLMLLVAVKGTTSADHQTIANMHSSSLAEMILMNSDAVGHYINPLPGQLAACIGADQSCSQDELAAGFMADWEAQLGADLPNGTGLVCLDATPDDGHADMPSCDGAGGTVIKVFWQESSDGENKAVSEHRIVSQLPVP
jgi:type IV pilus assembly protein PilV